MPIGVLQTVFDVDRSSLLFGGNPSVWYINLKMDKKCDGDHIPRFSKADMDDVVERNAVFQFAPGVTLKDLMKTATALSYHALEEATFELWTAGRLVVVGDSAHKMTPDVRTHSRCFKVPKLTRASAGSRREPSHRECSGTYEQSSGHATRP